MLQGLREKNYYEILSVPCNASVHEIQRAYKVSKETFQGYSLATYSLFSDKETKEVFGLISEAFYTLSDPKLRQAYDTKISKNGTYPTPKVPAMPVNNTKTVNDAKVANGFQATSSSYPPASSETRPQFKASPFNGAINRSPRTFFPPQKDKTPRTNEIKHISLQAHAARTEAATIENKNRLVKQKEKLQNLIQPGRKFDGVALKSAREACGYSLTSMAEETKIRYTYLDCLEKEDFRSLPSRIYVRGFIALICETLGLSVQSACKDYMTIYDTQTSP